MVPLPDLLRFASRLGIRNCTSPFWSSTKPSACLAIELVAHLHEQGIEGPIHAPVSISMTDVSTGGTREFSVAFSIPGVEDSTAFKAATSSGRTKLTAEFVLPEEVAAKCIRGTQAGRCVRCDTGQNYQCKECGLSVCDPKTCRDCFYEHWYSNHAEGEDRLATLVKNPKGRKIKCAECNAYNRQLVCSICEVTLCGSSRNRDYTCYLKHCQKHHQEGKKFLPEPFKKK